MVTFFGLLVAALVFLFWVAVFLAGIIIIGAVLAGIAYALALVIKS